MATFDIDQFRTALGSGGARPNQFMVELPRGLERVSTFLVTAASLPGQTINPASIYYRGREVKLAGDRTFSPWVTTIINDTGFTIRKTIEDWMSSIEHLQLKRGEVNPGGYFGEIKVHQLTKNGGTPIRTYVLRGAWPTDISDVPLGFDANDQISSFSCTWVYQDFAINGSSFSSTSGIFGALSSSATTLFGGDDIRGQTVPESNESDVEFGFNPEAGV